MMQSNDTKWVLLGDYISVCDERNTDKRYGIDSVMGVSIAKKFISTKADMTGVSLSPYKLVKPNEFCFVTITSRNGGKISLALNESEDVYIVSSSYEVFKIEDVNVLSPEYLFLWFNQPEFDRYARFHSWGSAREAFSYDDMCRVRIPLPSPEKQRELVATWKGLRDMKEQNEAMAAPLMQLCQSRLQYHKHTYPLVELRDYIRSVTEKNKDLEIKLEQGINIKKEFITPQRSNSDLSSRVKVRRGQFAYCTQLNNENVAVAYRTGEDCVVSPVYEVFEIVDKSILLPEYLLQWLIRPELGRFVYWSSVGSAYEFLKWDNLCGCKITIPPISEQKAIVDIYNCALECKRIAEEADRLSREICPALMQKAIRG